MAPEKRSIADLPNDGERSFIKGTVESPKGYWVTYRAATDTWERDS